MSLTIVVPVYNEEASLPFVLPELKEFAREHDFKLIIVDDGSNDSSKKLIDQLTGSDDFKAVHHKINCGYGAAIKTGIRLAEYNLCNNHRCGWTTQDGRYSSVISMK